jgi:BirA family biotin operon repressor/biotin-[acetyl-CoA-carboxylase] ligase
VEHGFPERDRRDAEAIRRALEDHPWRDLVQVLPVTDSTNNALKLLAAGGALEGTTLIAERQTAGRGRLDRRFDSPAGSGIYLSVLLRPACPPAELMTLTAQAAAAVRRAVGEVCGVLPGIKWVNDLQLNGKKICGILTELSFGAGGLVASAVVGIGVNCNRAAEDFPAELQGIAGSILSETGRRVDRNRLAAAMLRELSSLPRLDWREEYRGACVNLGRRVRILSPGAADCPEGVAEDVGPDAELLVRTDGGQLIAVAAGEVSLRDADAGQLTVDN